MAARSPQVGVGVIVQRGTQVLLGRRLGAHGAGHWALPGGHLEFGENIEDCAARELLEETGLRAARFVRGPYTSDVFADSGRHYVTLFVLARGVAGEPLTLEPDKCEGWQWFDWQALPEPLFMPLQTLHRSGWQPGGPR